MYLKYKLRRITTEQTGCWVILCTTLTPLRQISDTIMIIHGLFTSLIGEAGDGADGMDGDIIMAGDATFVIILPSILLHSSGLMDPIPHFMMLLIVLLLILIAWTLLMMVQEW